MDVLIVQKVLEGDESKFSYFIDTYKDMAYSIAFRIINNAEDAEEVVQDSFLKAYRSLGKFRHDSKFSTWFYKIVVNCALSKMKKRKPEFTHEYQIKDSEVDPAEVDMEYRNLGVEEQKLVISAALDQLQQEDRLLLTLYYLNENSINEVSQICGIKRENVKMKLHRARKKMYILLSTILQTKQNNNRQ